MQKPAVLVTFAVVGLAACTSPAPRPETATATPTKTTPTTTATPAVDEAPSPPATFAEAVLRFGGDCPGPRFTVPAEVVTVGDRTFTRTGSTLTLTPPVDGAVVIGVVGAVKDAEPETRENLQKAAAAFSRAGAQLVLVNGDVVGHETAALAPVTAMLDDVFALPVLVHSGNYEWTSALTEAVAEHPGLINGNLVRELDLGAAQLLTLPGYFNRRFLQPGACHYDDEDVADLAERAKAIASRGGRVILSSHGPPLQKNALALDITSDGEHVGDPAINALMKGAGITVGIFSHILEAGGRVVSDIDDGRAVKLPMKAPLPTLLVNVGSASSFGWGMADGTTSRGIAAIVTIDKDGGTRADLLKLR